VLIIYLSTQSKTRQVSEQEHPMLLLDAGMTQHDPGNQSYDDMMVLLLTPILEHSHSHQGKKAGYSSSLINHHKAK
jgi:hypothetical protein